MNGFVGIVCGLKSEAVAVRASMKSAGIDENKVRIGVSGANADRAEEIAQGFLDDGTRAIISAGLCGGLDPALKSGDIVLGERVVSAQGDIVIADKKLSAAADRFMPRHVAIFGSDEIVESVEKKKALYQRYAAETVDMESHGAARAAAKAGIPFIAIRVVADGHDRTLPKAALRAVTPSGGVNVMNVLVDCVKSPQQFEQIFALGRDSGAATEVLRRDFGRFLGAFLSALDL
jgi:adenosylhomocysteine nucleosidase